MLVQTDEKFHIKNYEIMKICILIGHRFNFEEFYRKINKKKWPMASIKLNICVGRMKKILKTHQEQIITV